MVTVTNKVDTCMNLTFIKNLNYKEPKAILIGSRRNTGGQLVGVAQIREWIASVPSDTKIRSFICFPIFTIGRTVIPGSQDRIFRWRRFQGWFEKRRAVIASQKEQKGVGARSITIITLTKKQKCLRDSDNGRSYLRWKTSKTKDILLVLKIFQENFKEKYVLKKF